MSQDTTTYALEMRGVSKRFPGTLAVNEVDFCVKPGEVHALIGENGAGKSTLMKMIAGSFSDYTGDIFVGGKKVQLHTPSMAKESGIGMIYQELSLARPISIYENLLIGRLPVRKGLPIVNRKEGIAQAKELLGRVGLSHLDPEMPISEISQCEAQLVEIAKVLGNNPRILVMDEPTSALSSEEVGRLFAIVKQLKEEGLAIIYISHHLAEIFAVADTVTVMRDGEKIGVYDIGDTNPQHLIELMVGRSVSEFYKDRETKVGDVLLQVENLSRWGFFHHVSFAVHSGEILGITGLAGAGRSELARSIIGVDGIDEGKIILEGKEVRFKSMHEAIDAGIGYLTESRKTDGLALTQSIADNALSAIVYRLAKHGIYNPKSRVNRAHVDDLMAKLVVYPAEADRPVTNLSGGNQQKVLLCKWLAMQPRVLILDEPTRGVDVGAKEVIHNAVRELAAAGNAVILISSDLPEMVGLSDRAVVLRNGVIIGEVGRAAMSEQSLLLAANGEGEYVHV
ncbi:MAG: sugar ABC transporter ATP-binding protein [Ruthenibacterium sp.]